MDISNMNQQQFQDMFGVNDGGSSTPRFGMEETNMDMFNPSLTETTTQASSITETTTIASSTTDTTTIASSTTETTTLNTDMFGDDEEARKKAAESGNQPELTGISDYFKTRFEEGKLAAIMEEDEQGNKTPFIPTTPEDIDRVIDLQINYQLEQKAKEVEENFYKSKSPAWQAVMRYAELVDDPSEILPFVQGVQNIQSVASIDETQVEGAEKIVRFQLSKSGQVQEIIDTQIEALKTTGKIIETAQKLKPAILDQESKALAKMQSDENKRVEDYRNMVTELRDKAIEAIESPFGKEPLKQDEKAAIFDLIAVPKPETQGYAIYNEIDNLYKNKDFETLRQIALMLTHKESFVKYLTHEAAQKVSTQLQKKLVIGTETRNGGGNDPEYQSKTITVPKGGLKGKPSFGR